MAGLLALFFLSGLTSLIYETLWIRVLSLGVGSTSASMSLVLAVFFLGLSAGSFACGRWIDRIEKPLRAYAILEAAIGIYSLALIYPLFHLNELLSLFNLASSIGFLASIIKLIIVATLLAIPTLAMGATLPLLVRHILQRGMTMGTTSSLLYGVNTLGGVSGALVASFILMPHFGIIATNHLAVLTNLAVALLALLLKPSLQNAQTEKPEIYFPLSAQQRKYILFASGICGFISIASEVVWNKYLGIFFGTNIYGLGLILALYLFGIAVGSLLLIKLLPRIQNRILFFNWLFIASLAFLFGASYLFNWAPVLSVRLHHAFGDFMSLLAVKLFVTSAILFIPTSIFGALFPLALTLLSPSKAEAPRWVGLGYAVNTVGAILGSYVAGIILVPQLGSSTTIRLVVLVGASTALALAVNDRTRLKSYSIGLLLLVTATFSLHNLDFRNILKSAYHRTDGTLAQDLARFTENFEEFKTILEGETGIISLSHDPKDGLYYKKYLRLKNNGLNESVYDNFRPRELPRYEALIAVLPYLLSANPKKVFLVGYGGGYTVDFLTSMPIDRVDVVELERAILDAAEIVKPKNPVLQRKNLNLKIEDARYILATQQLGKHDIIISQPSHSWLSGAANLFTEDFFKIVKNGLTEDGIFSQWLNLYNMDVAVLKSILRTFYSTFPNGAVFTNVGDQELVLIGSLKPIAFQWDRVTSLTANAEFTPMLAGIPLAQPTDLLTHYSFSREEALALAADAPLNTDRNVFAETRQSQLFYRDAQNEISPQAFLGTAYKGNIETLVPAAIGESPDFLYRVLSAMKEEQQYDKFHVLLQKYEARYGSYPDHFWQLGYLCIKAQRYESAERYLRAALSRKPNIDVFTLLLSALVESHRYEEALRMAKQYTFRNEASECYLADALLNARGLSAANSTYDSIFKNFNTYYNACGIYLNRVVGNYFFEKGDHKNAIAYYEAYTKEFSHDTILLRRMVTSYLALNQSEKAQHFGKYSQTVSETEIRQLKELARFYRESQLQGDASFLEARAEFVSEKP